MTKLNLAGGASTLPVLTVDNISAKFRWNYLFISLATLIMAYCVAGAVHKVFPFPKDHSDFWVAYEAARAIASGADLYQSVSRYIYPPLFACLLSPLAHFTYESALLIWLGINMTLLAVTLAAGIRALSSAFQLTLNLRQALGICSLAIILSYDPIRQNLLQGECDAVTLAGIALGLLWIDRRPSLAGVVLGMTVLIKYQSLFFLPFLLLRGRWRAAIAMMTGVIAASLLPAIVVGWKRNLEYLDLALRGLMHLGSSSSHVPGITWGRNISITNGLMRSFRDQGLSGNEALIMVMTIVLLTFLFLWWMFQHFNIPLLWRSRRTLESPQKESAIFHLECAALLICLLAFSPQSTMRHQFLLLNVKLLASMMLLFPTPNFKRRPLIIVIIMMQLVQPILLHFPQFYVWNHIGGPGWTLWLFLAVITWSGLTYISRNNRAKS